MDARTRARLLSSAAPAAGEACGDLGCGSGAFTLPLLDAVGAHGFVLAVDRDREALLALRARIAQHDACGRAELRLADVGDPGELPALDGVVLANVLHYLPDPAQALGMWRRSVRPGGRMLLVEYDRRDANPWVPYPIPASALDTLATAAGLDGFEVRATARSDFGATLYAAVATI